MAESWPENSTEVWRAFSSAGLAWEGCVACLSDEERERCQAPVIPQARRLLTAAAVLKRSVLARYLNIPAREIRFELGLHGKPRVVRAQNPNDYRFNLSHSGSVALLAVARGREVGVDVERVRAVQWPLIAAQVFSPAEQTAVRAAPPGEQTRVFFRHWTAREAYLKALGCGLAPGLASPPEATVLRVQGDLIRVHGPRPGPPAWRGLLFGVGEEYQAALVEEDPHAGQSPLNVQPSLNVNLRDWGPDLAASPAEAAV